MIKPLIKLNLGVSLLFLQLVRDVSVRIALPLIQTIYFVERNDEGTLSRFEQVDTLNRLLFETVHDVDDENGDVA